MQYLKEIPDLQTSYYANIWQILAGDTPPRAMGWNQEKSCWNKFTQKQNITKDQKVLKKYSSMTNTEGVGEHVLVNSPWAYCLEHGLPILLPIILGLQDYTTTY